MSKQQILFLEDHFMTAKRSISEMELDRSRARSHAASVSHDARRSSRQSTNRGRSAREATIKAHTSIVRAHTPASSNHLDQADTETPTNTNSQIETQSPPLQNNRPLPKSCLSSSLGGCWGEAEDTHYLKQWLSITGPWHACYDNASHELKHQDHSSDASELPVTRHLLVAIALLEEPLSPDNLSAVKARKEKITRHYRSAVSALQGAGSISLDTVAAAAIAWLFETARARETAAEVHLRAFDRIQKDYLLSRPLNGEEDATGTLENLVCRCFECRSSNRFSLREMQKHGLFHFTLRGPSCSAMKSDLTLPIVLAQIEQYLDRLEVHRDNEFADFSMVEAAGLIRRWDLELLKLRHRREHVSDVIFVARLLIMIVISLLPKRAGATFVLEPDVFAWNFCLCKIEQMIHGTELRQLDRQYIGIVAIDILTVIVRFASDEKHVFKAADMLQSVSGFV